MAVITDQVTVDFVNQVIRPMAEFMTTLDLDGGLSQTQWNAVINATGSPLQVAANDDTIDASNVPGANVLTKADVVNFITQLNTYMTQMAGGGVRDVIRKPNVRSRFPRSG